MYLTIAAGAGYPNGLKGTDIPFGARVVAVADSYDAMTSDRPYRAGMPPEKAVAILRDGRGRQWDADVVDALLRHVSRGLAATDSAEDADGRGAPPVPSTGQISFASENVRVGDA